MLNLTTKQYAKILQKRCAITIASTGEESEVESFGKTGIIRVGPVESCGEGEYCFDISEQDVVKLKGKPRRQIVWSCAVVVTADHEIEVYEERGFEERVPPGVIECATTPIRPEEHLLSQ
jgi:hypothetical protein